MHKECVVVQNTLTHAFMPIVKQKKTKKHGWGGGGRSYKQRNDILHIETNMSFLLLQTSIKHVS